MPCWVAPTVAAELWGVSLEFIHGVIAEGVVPSRHECGFLVVDIAPDSASKPAAPPPGPPPLTYVVGEWQEPEDPVAVPWEPDAPAPQPVSLPSVLPGPVDDELPPLDEEEDDKPITNWRQVRSNVGRTRRPPTRTPPPPAAFAA